MCERERERERERDLLTSLKAMRCWVLSGAAGLSDLKPQWCALVIGTEDFLDREG